MTYLRFLFLALALSAVAGLSACGDDDFSSDGGTTQQQDLSATVHDLSAHD